MSHRIVIIIILKNGIDLFELALEYVQVWNASPVDVLERLTLIIRPQRAFVIVYDYYVGEQRPIHLFVMHLIFFLSDKLGTLLTTQAPAPVHYLSQSNHPQQVQGKALLLLECSP